MIETDITDCYGSIYTHSIAWAVHGRELAKEKRDNSALLGNTIDKCIQNMRSGQTNGIPQGSALMDLVAEIVLGYGDLLLTERLVDEKISRYKILRYRDDYKVFVNSPPEGETIIRILSEILEELGLKLSAGKTKLNNEVIRSAVKKDKVEWLKKKHSATSLQKRFIFIAGTWC